jgi:hypothetical protein
MEFLDGYRKYKQLKSEYERTELDIADLQANIDIALVEEEKKNHRKAEDESLLNAAMHKVNALAFADGESVEAYIRRKAPHFTFPWSPYQATSPELGSVYHVPEKPTVEYEVRSCTMPEERLAIVLAEATRSDGSHVFAVGCTIMETFCEYIRGEGYNQWDQTRIEYRIVAKKDIRL